MVHLPNASESLSDSALDAIRNNLMWLGTESIIYMDDLDDAVAIARRLLAEVDRLREVAEAYNEMRGRVIDLEQEVRDIECDNRALEDDKNHFQRVLDEMKTWTEELANLATEAKRHKLPTVNGMGVIIDTMLIRGAGV